MQNYLTKEFILIIMVCSFMLTLGFSISNYKVTGEVQAANLVQNQTISLELSSFDLFGTPSDASNVFSVGDFVQAHVTINSKSNSPVPVNLNIFKDIEDPDKILSNVTRAAQSYYCSYYYEDSNGNDTNGTNTNTNNNECNTFETDFNLNGITDSGRYVIKATISGTNNYAKVTAIYENKTWHFLVNDLLTFQNLKILVALLSLVGMISFLIYQVRHWNETRFIDKRTRTSNELIGFIMMTIMVLSIISYLSSVDTPIGANTSFGIVSRSDLSPDLIVGMNVAPNIIKDIKKEWVLNLGGSAQSLCIDRNSGNVTFNEKVAERNAEESCSYIYSTNPFAQYEGFTIFNGGIQIPLYVPILGFIGAYLRYVYNITLRTIKIKKGKDDDYVLNSLKGFLHEFVIIILSPIAALALWLFLRQGGIESDLSLALSSITVGLALEPFIKRLQKWLPDQLDKEKQKKQEDGDHDDDDEHPEGGEGDEHPEGGEGGEGDEHPEGGEGGEGDEHPEGGEKYK